MKARSWEYKKILNYVEANPGCNVGNLCDALQGTSWHYRVKVHRKLKELIIDGSVIVVHFKNQKKLYLECPF